MSSRSRRADGWNLDPLGLLVLTVAAGTAVGAYLIARPLFSSQSQESKSADRARDAASAVRKFELAMDNHVAQIEGRSLFSIPPEPASTADDGPKATTYSGPQLIAYVNNTAWFSDGQKLSPESPKASTLELIRADPPWSVRVRWEGGEFDVELFKRVPLSSLNQPLRSEGGLLPPGSTFNPPRGAAAGGPGALTPPPLGQAPAGINTYPTGRPTSAGYGPGAFQPGGASHTGDPSPATPPEHPAHEPSPPPAPPASPPAEPTPQPQPEPAAPPPSNPPEPSDP